MDDFSTVPDRTNSTLHVDRNNETVVSGMTECSSYNFDTPLYSSSEAAEAARRVSNTAMPPSRFRGGTASRLGSNRHLYGGASSSGASVSSRGSSGSRMDRSTRSAMSRSQFEPITEEQDDDDDYVSVVSGRSGGGAPSVKSARSRRTAGDDNSIWMGSENASLHQGLQNSINYGDGSGQGSEQGGGEEEERGFRFSAGFPSASYFSGGQSVSSGMSGWNESDDTSVARGGASNNPPFFGSNPAFGRNSISGNSSRKRGGTQSVTSGSSIASGGSSNPPFFTSNPAFGRNSISGDGSRRGGNQSVTSGSSIASGASNPPFFTSNPAFGRNSISGDGSRRGGTQSVTSGSSIASGTSNPPFFTSNPAFGKNSISGNSRGGGQSVVSGSSASGQQSVSEHGSSKGSFVGYNPQGQGTSFNGNTTTNILPESQGFNPRTSEMFTVREDASVVSGISMGRSIASRSVRGSARGSSHRSSGLTSSQFSQQGGSSSSRPGLDPSDRQRSISSMWNESVERRERSGESSADGGASAAQHSMGGRSITSMWNDSVERRERGHAGSVAGASTAQHSMGGRSITSMWNDSVERRNSAEVSGEDLLDDGKSVVSSAQQSVASQRHRPPVPFSRASMMQQAPPQEDEEDDEVSITKDERDKMLLNAFDNTRLPTHKAKDYATQEVDVSNYQEVILDSDEMSTLPEEYVLDDFGKRYHPSKKELEAERLRLESEKRDDDRLDILPMNSGGYYDPHHSGPFSKKQRMHSLMTIMAAVALVIVGICMSISSLSTPNRYGKQQQKSAGDGSNGGYLYLPGYQFGGGIGGIEGGQDLERRKQLAQDYLGIGPQQQAPPMDHAANAAPAGFAPVVEKNNSPSEGGYSGGRNDYQGGGGPQGIASYQTTGGEDPFSGMGPPQFNPEYGTALLPPLTSAPLTSYAPPSNEDGTVIVLEESFHGSIQELSVLPYNPHLEMPVVLDIPLSGGAATKQIFGNCIKLVQCTERGRDILAREHSLHKGEDVNDESSATRHLSSQEEDSSVATSKIDPSKRQLEEEGTAFDPPLRTEVVYTSTYVNVDCTMPTGIDRGIAHDLVGSDMVDVIYSPDIHDVARLFAPPIKSYGRGVVLIRNPLERAVAKYNWLRNIDNAVKAMSLEEFANSDQLEDNILTRALVGKVASNEPLLDRDLSIAKEILKRKFVVGLFDRMEASIVRFETFFGWMVGEGVHACQQNEITQALAKPYNNVVIPQGNADVMSALEGKNQLDLMLYEYGRFLYNYQGHVLFGENAGLMPKMY